MLYLRLFGILCFFSIPWLSLALLGFGSKANENGGSESDDFNGTGASPALTSCPAPQLSGVEWILHIRQPDYGWKENTHRAIIALVVSNWENFVSTSERLLMEHQLEVEISRSLLRNSSFPVYPNNLALFIHALIATNRNPRNFHNIDLVARLIDLVRGYEQTTHPFILLALCNAKSFEPRNTHVLEYYLRHNQNSRKSMEYKALALQAYECAGSQNIKINDSVVFENRRFLISQQYPDGSFGNVYTTALIVQALASAPHLSWNKKGALDYLRKQSLTEVNMVSTYLIQLALNAERIKFIKDIHPELIMERAETKKAEKFFIQYSLRVGRYPNVHHTITINVPPNSNFFEVMKLSSANDPKYNFSYYMDKNKEPSIYAISDVPNDAEENLYWRLCVQTDINHDRHTSTVKTFQRSPIHLLPKEKDHVVYWYMDIDCEETV
ncbi:uncharacterized protein CG3556 isoform X3 [Parasteatoda tepidariorum]|uniref:uncharacterized protein CG3556 isoform X3 n=1 Tax=Parasteatoda tepidariorum TaxID=114398 RepID=UPI001C71C353|nr:uncharacterized protein CG3556 isoform X1 [Parasteatoda tepidariorum]